MSRSSALGAVMFVAESAFGENSQSVAGATRLAVLGEVDVSALQHAKLEPQRVTQFRQDGTIHIPGVMGGGFKMRLWLAGHGSAPTGAISATALGTYLGAVFGGTTSTGAGTTFTGGSASVPTTTSSGTLAAGQLIRGGALNDGRANGQWAAVGTHVTTTLTLLTAFAAAPNNGDVLYSCEQVFSPENPTDPTVTTYRFWLATGNTRWLCHGCFPRSVTFSGLANGEIPAIEVDWGVAWFEPEATITFPTTTSVDTFTPAPVAAGSLFLQSTGTVTRATLTVHDFQLSYGLGIVPTMGPGGVNNYQNIIGVRRTRDTITGSFVVEAENASATPTWYTNWLTNAERHMLYSMSVGAGSAMAMYFPRICLTGDRPTQMSDAGLNRLRVNFAAYTGGTTTSETTLSAFRMGLG